MATLRELKGRIVSVASSEKITGAMKMISSAKMHKAEQSLRKQLPYRQLIEGIIGNLMSSDAEFTTPLTEVREVKRETILVWGSDDGLCGAYNVNIYKLLLEQIGKIQQSEDGAKEIRIIPIGSKMLKAVRKLSVMEGVEVETAPQGINSKSSGTVVKGFLQELEQRYVTEETDNVSVLYMNFQSVSRQRPRFDRLLPLGADTFASEGISQSARPCIFEPSAAEIFRAIIPLYLLSMLQEIFTENRASEQAARIMAMQAANDNAKKLLEQLRLEYNKLRQQAITNELLDIIGGQVR